LEQLPENDTIAGNVKDFPDSEKKILSEMGVLSILCIPIFVEEKLWGFIGFSTLHHERIWEKSEISALRIVAVLIGNVLQKEKIEKDLGQSESEYKILFEQMLEGFALHQIILDENNTPVDYKFLEVNTEFCKMTGLEKDKIINHTVKEVMPDVESNWIDRYGEVALGKGPIRFEEYSKPIDKWFEVNAYSPKMNQFVTIVKDISNAKKHDAQVQEKILELERINKVMIDRELKMIELKEKLKTYEQKPS
jgi:PAS domain S-box-containing protein